MITPIWKPTGNLHIDAATMPVELIKAIPVKVRKPKNLDRAMVALNARLIREAERKVV